MRRLLKLCQSDQWGLLEAKLKGRRRNVRKHEDLYIGKGGAPAEEPPEAQQIYDKLILALLDEFDTIRKTLPNLGRKHIKHKPGVYNARKSSRSQSFQEYYGFPSRDAAMSHIMMLLNMPSASFTYS